MYTDVDLDGKYSFNDINMQELLLLDEILHEFECMMLARRNLASEHRIPDMVKLADRVRRQIFDVVGQFAHSRMQLTNSPDAIVADEPPKNPAKDTGKKVMVLEASVAPEKQEEQKTEDINAKITTWQQAVNYFCPTDEEPKRQFHKASDAFIKLSLIAKVWNHADGFTPDFRNPYQEKWHPVFFPSTSGKFAFAFPDVTYTYMNCSGLFFKTRERSEQFGRQFIGLWNAFLHNRQP
jgi:hypothetical protein